MPSNIDPSLFNFTLAWIEYGNRILGVVVGLLILVTAILAILHAKHWKRVWMPAVGAALLVAYIGWQGGQVVAASLKPILVSFHLIGSMLVASLALFAAIQAHYIGHPEAETATRYPNKIGRWLIVAWVFALVQSALGTQVRAAVKMIAEAKPLAGGNVWLDAVGPIRHIHEALGVVVAGLAVHIAIKLLKRSERPSLIATQGAWALGAVGVLQFLLGIGMIAVSYADILKLFHLWCASLIVGLLLLLYAAVRQSERGQE